MWRYGPAGLRGDHDRVPSLSGRTRRSSLAMGTLRRSAGEASPQAGSWLSGPPVCSALTAGAPARFPARPVLSVPTAGEVGPPNARFARPSLVPRGPLRKAAGHLEGSRGGYVLVRPGRAAQSAAAAASYAPGTSGAAAHRGQHPPCEGGHAAAGAASSKRLVIHCPPGRHPAGVSRGSPRSSPFHGLDGVQDTRARHDAPSPRSVRAPPARRQRRRRENRPPSSAEPPMPLLIPGQVLDGCSRPPRAGPLPPPRWRSGWEDHCQVPNPGLITNRNYHRR
jgi:hypothetical protein